MNNTLTKAPRRWDLILSILLFLFGFLLVIHYTFHRDLQSSFQFYYEPAVMMACGKGFMSTNGNAGDALKSFMDLQRITFSCNDLPQHLNLQPVHVLKGWYHTLFTIAYLWRLTGISWYSLYFMIAFMCGMVTVIWYWLYRFGMGIFLSVFGVVAFSLLPTNFAAFMSVRDYSKAPFILLSLLILTFLVTRKISGYRLFFCCMLLGGIAGIGYGFRPDTLVIMPPIVITLLFFLPQNNWRFWPRNIIACLLVFGCYVGAAFPALSSYQDKNVGTCFWHVPLLGFRTLSTIDLGIHPSIYAVNNITVDEGAYFAVSALATEFLHQPPPKICSHDFDTISGILYKKIVTTLPADIIVRCYRSLYSILKAKGIIVSVIAIVIILATNVRVGLWLLLGLLYFFSLPMIYFQARHYFYLIFWLWWPLGFLSTLLWKFFLYYRQREHWPQFWHDISVSEKILLKRGLKRTLILISVLTIFLASILFFARIYQTKQVIKIIESYQLAKKHLLSYQIIPNKTLINNEKMNTYKITWPKNLTQLTPISESQATIVPKMLHVQIGGIKCNAVKLAVLLTYKTTFNWFSFSTMSMLDFEKTPHSIYNVYLPIYFVSGNTSPISEEVPMARTSGLVIPEGIELPQKASSCFIEMDEVETDKLYDLWLNLVLPQNWHQLPLYQQFY